MSANEILRKMVKKLAACRKELAACRKELEEERITKESFRESFDMATKVARKMVNEGCELRERAEKERDYYAKELEREHRLRLEAEYDKEYYQMQIVQHGLNDMGVD